MLIFLRRSVLSSLKTESIQNFKFLKEFWSQWFLRRSFLNSLKRGSIRTIRFLKAFGVKEEVSEISDF